jgi:hypothetical protein
VAPSIYKIISVRREEKGKFVSLLQLEAFLDSKGDSSFSHASSWHGACSQCSLWSRLIDKRCFVHVVRISRLIVACDVPKASEIALSCCAIVRTSNFSDVLSRWLLSLTQLLNGVRSLESHGDAWNSQDIQATTFGAVAFCTEGVYPKDECFLS